MYKVDYTIDSEPHCVYLLGTHLNMPFSIYPEKIKKTLESIKNCPVASEFPRNLFTNRYNFCQKFLNSKSIKEAIEKDSFNTFCDKNNIQHDYSKKYFWKDIKDYLSQYSAEIFTDIEKLPKAIVVDLVINKMRINSINTEILEQIMGD